MTVKRMSDSMVKNVAMLTRRLLEEAKIEFGRDLDKGATQPMTTLTKNVTFEITTPQDGAREFVFACSLTEQATPDGNPTTGFSRVTK